MDPLRDAQYDRVEAEKLRREERYESDPAARRDLERAAQRFDEEATEFENEATPAEEPEAEAESEEEQ